MPEGWAWCKGNQIFLPMESRKPKGDYFKYIDIDAIDNKNNLVKSPKLVKTKEAPSRASRQTNIGDVLFSMVRPYLRNIAQVKEEDCIASTGFFVCKPIQALHPEYLYLLMISNYVVDGINQFMKGDNSPSVNGDDILNWLYPVPPLDEQKQIVIKINEIFEQLNFIEKNKTDLQTAIKQAKSKILDLAIHGKLVPQDSSDEPVSVLLEKIREEKEAKIKAGELKRDKNDSYIYKNTSHN